MRPKIQRPLWVNRVVLSLRRLLPVFPDKQTSCTETGTSEKCQQRSERLKLCGERPSPRTRQSDKVSNYCGTIVLANSETDKRPGRLALYWNVDNAVGTDMFEGVWHDRYPEPCRHQVYDRSNHHQWIFVFQHRAKSRTLATCDDAVVETGRNRAGGKNNRFLGKCGERHEALAGLRVIRRQHDPQSLLDERMNCDLLAVSEGRSDEGDVNGTIP